MDEAEGDPVGEEGELVGEEGDVNPGVVAAVPGIAEVAEEGESQVNICCRTCHGSLLRPLCHNGVVEIRFPSFF